MSTEGHLASHAITEMADSVADGGDNEDHVKIEVASLGTHDDGKAVSENKEDDLVAEIVAKSYIDSLMEKASINIANQEADSAQNNEAVELPAWPQAVFEGLNEAIISKDGPESQVVRLDNDRRAAFENLE